MSKARRHFFEVFQGSAAQADPVTRSAPACEAMTPSSPLLVPRSRYMTLRVTRETLILVGLLFAGLLFVAFFWGYQRGASSRFDAAAAAAAQAETKPAETRPAAATPAAPAAQAGVAAPVTPAALRPTLALADEASANGPGVFSSLVVWTSQSQDQAREIAKEVSTPRHLAYVVQLKNTRGYMVTVGRFDSTKTPEAEALKREFQDKIYKGKKQFLNCYWKEIREPTKKP
jgi:hypothetical protein